MNNEELSIENEDIVHQWEPFKFNITEDYEYVPTSILFNLFSNIIYYGIAFPVIAIITKIVYDLKIEGRENIEKLQSGAVSISNHVLFLDCAMIGLACIKKKIYYTTREGSFKIPFVRKLIKLLRAIPIPKDIKNKEHFINAIDKLLKDKKIVHFYPEASLWSYHEKLRNFKNGAFKFAVKNDVPILPIVITFREPEGIRKMFKSKKDVTLNILPPVYSDSNSYKTQAEREDELKKRVYNIMEKYFN